MATVTSNFVASVDQATSTTHAITGVTVSAGDLAVLRFGYQSDSVTISGVADNAGNTWSVATSVHSVSGDTQTSAIAYLVVPGGGLSGATVTVTLSATSTFAGDITYYNSSTGWEGQSTVLDKVSGNNTGLVTNWTSNSTATTIVADELLVGVAYSGGSINGGSSSASGSWTEEAEYNLTHGYKLVTEWQHVTSTGGYAATGTWSAAEIAACCIATFITGGQTLPAFPVVSSVVESANPTTAATSHTVTYPSSIAAGDTLLMIADKGSTAATINSITGWTELLDENSANGLYAAWKKADGTESGTFTVTTSASTRLAVMVYRITSAADPTVSPPEIGTTATGTSTTPDPPSLTPSGGSKDYLWVTFYGAAGEEADDDTWSDTPPSGFSPSPPRQISCGTVGTNLGGLLAAAEVGETASTKNPGTFAKDVSAAWRAQTIAVYPAAGGTPITKDITNATETDTAQTLSYNLGTPISKTLGIAVETDTAQTLAFTKAAISKTLGIALETDVSQPLAFTKAAISKTLTAATETDTAQTLVFALNPITKTLTAAVETDTAQTLSYAVQSAIQMAITAAVETDTAQTLSFSQTGGDIIITISPASETDTAQALSFSQTAISKTITAATTTEVAQAMSTTQAPIVLGISPASTTNVAQPLSVLVQALSVNITPALETDQAQPLSFTGGAAVIATQIHRWYISRPGIY